MKARTGPGAAGATFGKTKELGGGAGVVNGLPGLLRLVIEFADEPRRSIGRRRDGFVVDVEDAEERGEDGGARVARDDEGINVFEGEVDLGRAGAIIRRDTLGPDTSKVMTHVSMWQQIILAERAYGLAL